MSMFIWLAMVLGLEEEEEVGEGLRARLCVGAECTVATAGQKHLHAYCTYMVVLRIHQECS